MNQDVIQQIHQFNKEIEQLKTSQRHLRLIGLICVPVSLISFTVTLLFVFISEVLASVFGIVSSTTFVMMIVFLVLASALYNKRIKAKEEMLYNITKQNINKKGT